MFSLGGCFFLGALLDGGPKHPPESLEEQGQERRPPLPLPGPAGDPPAVRGPPEPHREDQGHEREDQQGERGESG